jgi:hypothetical protein
VGAAANAIKEHDQLQLEEDPRIDTWPPLACYIAVLHQLGHEGEIEHAVRVVVEVVGGDEIIEREC